MIWAASIYTLRAALKFLLDIVFEAVFTEIMAALLNNNSIFDLYIIVAAWAGE